MKIIHILAVLLIAITLALSACSSTTSPTTSQPTVQVPTRQEPTETAQTPSTPTITPTPSPTSPSQTMSVHFIDVGQGDSILIDLGDTEVLIDGGERNTGAANYLTSYVDGALEVMVATHTDADHIGGLIDVLAKYQVKDIWLNGYTATSATYKTFMNAVNSEGATIHQAELGNIIQAGTLKFSVLNPSKPLFSDANNNSIVLSLSYGDVDFLFMGDAEKEAEAKMLVQSVVPIPDCEILKVGHHGSRSASSLQFLNLAKPDIAVYSCGIGNTYGHPHQETLVALDSVGAKIYGTDVHGTVVVTSDGKIYNVQTTKQAPLVKPSNVSPIPTPSPTLTPTPTPTPTPSTATNVKITKIFYDGLVPRTESDEYVEITNQGSESVDLKGWVLKDISEGYPSFTFPSYVLQPSKSIRVYTNEIHPEYGGFSFGSGKAVWNNTSPDTAALFNAQGQEVSRKSY
jgi:beta-lactamase superfamily II metal-dependent hydrolase